MQRESIATTTNIHSTLATMEEELLLMKEKDKKATEEQKELLCKQIEELKYSTAVLLAENETFKWFIGRLDSQDLDPHARGESPQAAGDFQLGGGGAERKQKSCSTLSDHLQLLTLEQKLYVIRREVTETRQDQEKVKQEYERIQDSYKASEKEAELRLADVKKAKKEFEHGLLKSMNDNRLELKEPEKVLQYTEDRSKHTQLEKFNQKNLALKVQEKKLLQQIQQKKEMGKAEYEVFFQEFDEPRIVKQLDELQLNNLKIHRVLSTLKEKLQNITLESTELSSDAIKRNQVLTKIEEEIQHAEKERLKAEGLNQRLRKELTDYQAPDITEYMSAKDNHKNLQQSIHSWERKVGIAEMALKTHRREWSKQRVILTPANSAAFGATRPGEHQIPVKLPHIAKGNT